MSKGIRCKLKASVNEAIEALTEIGSKVGWKVSRDASELGSYYSPEQNIGKTPIAVATIPGVNITMYDKHPNSNVRHSGGSVTTNVPGLNMPVTIWGNGIAIVEGEDGKAEVWVDIGAGFDPSKLTEDQKKLYDKMNTTIQKKDKEAKPLTGEDYTKRIFTTAITAVIAAHRTKKAVPAITDQQIRDICALKPIAAPVETLATCKTKTPGFMGVKAPKAQPGIPTKTRAMI